MPSAHPLIDHDEIRRWAEARRAKPACVRRTGGKGDPGMIRLDFPGFSGRDSLSPISWDQWFKSFEGNNLALLVQDRTARGQQSNFNKLVSRESITEGLALRRRREQRGSSRSTRAVAAERKTGARKRTNASSRSATGRSGARKTSRGRKPSGARKAAGSSRSRSAGSSAGGSTRRQRGSASGSTRRRSR